MTEVTLKEYRQILKDWQRWVNQYYTLVGPTPELVELVKRTTNLLTREEKK